jgi:phosphoglycerol transferase MdoB-like AlkP superfamily enzyme
VETGRILPECLPKILRSRGFETLSFHGNTEALFERSRWYPDLGFDLSYFAENLGLKGGGARPECGVLIRGICDSEMARLVQRELKRSGTRPKFVYWLTLSSHLPVDAVLARDSEFDCATSATLKDEPGPCGLERILHRVHQQIARVALDPELPPTRFIVVGDHAPPFLEVAERVLYSADRVPYADLVPLIPSGSSRP